MKDSNTLAIPNRVDVPVFQDQSILKAGTIVSFCILGSFLAQPVILGSLPLKYFLKSVLHTSPGRMSLFFGIGAVCWYLKPFVGIFMDVFPLFGTRRRSYLLFSSLLASASWIAFAFVPHTYTVMLVMTAIVNFFLVVLSTSMGAFYVQVGRARSITGSLTSIRQVATGISSVIAGTLGGYLATLALFWMAGLSALLAASVFPVVYFLLKEKETASPDPALSAAGSGRLSAMLSARSFWYAAVFLALYYLAPGFGTILYYKQTDDLGFSQDLIGNISSWSAIAGILAGFVYFTLVRRIELRSLLFLGIGTAVLITFTYAFYDSLTAAVIIGGLNGFFSGFAELTLYDLAARSVPVGLEGFGFGILMSVRNVSLSASDFLGTQFVEKLHFKWNSLVVLTGCTKLLILPLLLLVPAVLICSKDKPAATPGVPGR